MTIDVIDLFAGPGGLGEGFASLDEGRKFKIAVSAEMEASAHQTLTLRSFFRHTRGDTKAERAYYDFCNSASAPHPRDVCGLAWRVAEAEARQLELGVDGHNKTLDQIIDSKRLDPDRTLVIGGPPCQAYSLVGRAKNQGTAGYVATEDHRHFLYREYLRILHKARPAVFVMENVKGILSSQVGGRRVFHDILRDLCHPGKALHRPVAKQADGYRIYSLVAPTHFERGMEPAAIDANDFVVRSERYGVPQARHRVILLGVRDDLQITPPKPLKALDAVTVRDAISALPKLRSRLSTNDGPASWEQTIKSLVINLSSDADEQGMPDLSAMLALRVQEVSAEWLTGGLRVASYDTALGKSRFHHLVSDPKLEVWLNHEARSHMAGDLARYFYAAAFADKFGRSPKGHADFKLKGLAPSHANWQSGKFEDRFRVQRFDQPSTTITSHISKDGHYYIHPDAAQCRSLTVREAARLQTFRDNYFFQGNRTQQYHQVGNAVPPLLAAKLSEVIAELLGA